MTSFDVEIGKLMAQFESLRLRIDELKKGMETTNKQVSKLHTDFVAFSSNVVTQMDEIFVRRTDLAPFKMALSFVAMTTFSAVCLSICELLFGKYF